MRDAITPDVGSAMISIYFKRSAAFGAGFVAVHGFRRRQDRVPFSVARELVCVPRDAMIGALVGPLLPLTPLLSVCPVGAGPSGPGAASASQRMTRTD